METLYSTVDYYSSWGHLKELVLVPYRKRDKSNVHLKTTVLKSERGTTTIILSRDGKETEKQAEKKLNKHAEETSKETVTKGGSLEAVTASKQPPTAPKKVASQKEKEVVDEGTSPAKEVQDYLYKEVYFAQSKDPRVSKPSNVQFSIGRVVKHAMDGYYAVIVGWDLVAKAPDSWIDTYYYDRKVIVHKLAGYFAVLS